MTVESLAEPTLESMELLLRDELAHGDAVLSTSAPVLRHLLAHGDNALLNDEVVARTRGLLADVASQLLDALAEAVAVANPVAFLVGRRDSLALALADEPALLAHAHALAIEGSLSLHLQARSGIDPVLCPQLQELVASPDSEVAGIAIAALAAQARFVLHHRQMTLPLGELPGDLLARAFHVLENHAAKRGNAARGAVHQLSAQFDENHSRLGLIAQLVAQLGEPNLGLDIRHSGVAIFATALAAASKQERDLCVLSLADGRGVRLALTLRAAGLTAADVESQLVHTDADVVLPQGFAALGEDRAALLLHGSAPGE